MKLKKILNELGHMGQHFTTIPTSYAKWQEKDFADKEFELDFLRKLNNDSEIEELDYTERNKVKSLIMAGLVRSVGNEYEITGKGIEWFDNFNNFSTDTIQTISANTGGVNARMGA